MEHGESGSLAEVQQLSWQSTGLGVGAVLEDLVRLVVQLALVEQVRASDALEDAGWRTPA